LKKVVKNGIFTHMVGENANFTHQVVENSEGVLADDLKEKGRTCMPAT